ncbi:MAG: flippase [Endomicrobiales bacterium]|nr:flippase [Endomicrobiales bacterium]
MKTTKLFAKNSLVTFVASLANKLLSFVFFIYVARYLGPTYFGKYSFIFSFITFFIIISSFGMDGLTVREVAKDKSSANAYLFNSTLLKLIFVALSWIIIVFLMILMKKDMHTNMGLLIISFCLLPDSILKSFRNIFWGYEKLEYNTLLDILFRVIIVALGLYFIFSDYGFLSILLVSIIASSITLLGAIYIYVFYIDRIKFQFDLNLCKYLLATGFPFLLTGILVSINHKIDKVMLSLIKGDDAVGWYGTAHGLTDALIFISTAINTSIYPIFSRLYKDCKTSFDTALNKTLKFLLILALPIAVGTTILSKKIILFAFPLDYTNSIVALRILIWGTSLFFMNSIMSSALYSTDRQKYIAKIGLAMAIINIVLNFIFIPKYSYIGASFTTVITEFIGFLWLFILNQRLVAKIQLLNPFIKSLASSTVMGIFILFIFNFNLFLVIGLGALCYFIMLIILKSFDNSDILLFKQMLPLKISNFIFKNSL